MIKVLLEDEQEIKEDIVVFNLKRHKYYQAPINENKLYLTGRCKFGINTSKQYPVKIDGDKRTITVHRDIIESLGFRLIIEGDIK